MPNFLHARPKWLTGFVIPFKSSASLASRVKTKVFLWSHYKDSGTPYRSTHIFKTTIVSSSKN
jgi:hypothetical protein